MSHLPQLEHRVFSAATGTRFQLGYNRVLPQEVEWAAVGCRLHSY